MRDLPFFWKSGCAALMPLSMMAMPTPLPVTPGVPGTPGVTGKGVGIAIIDSGISAAHPDFQKNGKSRIVTALDFTNGGTPYAGLDKDGHGTGVASVAAGNGN